MVISAQPNTRCCLSGFVEIFRPFLLLTSADWVLGSVSEQEGHDLTPASRKDSELYILGKRPSQVPWGLWGGGALVGWSLGMRPNPNMFCLALWVWWVKHQLYTHPHPCTCIPPTPLSDRVWGGYPSSETEPHTEDISYTWVDKLPTDVKGPLLTRPGVLELQRRGPDYGGPHEEGKQTKEWGRSPGGTHIPGRGGELTRGQLPAQGAFFWCCKFKAHGCLLRTRSLSPQLAGLLAQLWRPISWPLTLASPWRLLNFLWCVHSSP